MDTTPASRSDSVSSTECSCSCSSVKLTASPGWMASESSIRSPNSLSQRDDQPQVGLHQVILRPPAVFGGPLQVDALAGTQHPAAFGQLLLGEQPGLDPLGQLDLLPGVQQRHPPDLPEVVLDRIGTS